MDFAYNSVSNTDALINTFFIGYDLRVNFTHADIEDFCIKGSHPYSIDSNVWTSVKRPEWGLYSSFENLKTELTSDQILQNQLIAVEVLIEDYQASQTTLDYLIESGDKAYFIDNRKDFVGFDVGDSFLAAYIISSQSEIERLRPKFQKFMNDRNLFSDKSAADDFVQYKIQTIPGHAPYFIYSIYKMSYKAESERTSDFRSN